MVMLVLFVKLGNNNTMLVRIGVTFARKQTVLKQKRAPGGRATARKSALTQADF